MGTKENADGLVGEGARVIISAAPSMKELRAARARSDARPRKPVNRTAAEMLAIIRREQAAFEEIAKLARERKGAAL